MLVEITVGLAVAVGGGVRLGNGVEVVSHTVAVVAGGSVGSCKAAFLVVDRASMQPTNNTQTPSAIHKGTPLDSVRRSAL